MFFVPIDQKFNPFHYWGQNFRIFSWSLFPIIPHSHSFEKSYWLCLQNISRSDLWPPSYITSCLHYYSPLICSPVFHPHPVTSSGVIPVQGRLNHSTPGLRSPPVSQHVTRGRGEALTGLQDRAGRLPCFPLDHPTHPAHFCLRPFPACSLCRDCCNPRNLQRLSSQLSLKCPLLNEACLHPRFESCNILFLPLSSSLPHTTLFPPGTYRLQTYRVVYSLCLLHTASLSTPLEYKGHEGSLFCSLMYPKHLECCLARSIYSVSIWMNLLNGIEGILSRTWYHPSCVWGPIFSLGVGGLFQVISSLLHSPTPAKFVFSNGGPQTVFTSE